MDPPHVVVFPTRRPGRPPVDESGAEPADVHLKLPAADYDAAYKHARRNRESVQSILRRALKKLLADERGG
jgi:hypothetical protein